MARQPISLKAALVHGGRATLATWWPLGPVWLVYAALLKASTFLPEHLPRPADFLTYITIAPMFTVASIWPAYALHRLTLDHVDKRPLDLSTAFLRNPTVLPSTTFAVIFSLLFSLGVYLFVLPAVWVLVVYSAGAWLVADGRCGSLAALEASHDLVRGNRLRLLVAGVFISPLLALGHWLMGLFDGYGLLLAIAADTVVLSVGWHAAAHSYRQLMPEDASPIAWEAAA